MNGYLKIKTKIDNKDIEKGIVELESKIKKLQKENAETSYEENILQKQADDYDKLKAKADEYKNKIAELRKEIWKVDSNGNTLPISKTQYTQYYDEMFKVQEKASETRQLIEEQASKMEKVHAKLAKIKTKQEENNAKIQQYKDKIESINIQKVQKGINSAGKAIEGQIKKIGKMSMAIVGISTAWNAARSAMGTISQYNPQIAANIEYIKYALSSTILPVVEKIINLMAILLSYINAISQAWFGKTLFASAKEFKNIKDNMGNAAKSAKDINKSLQGFDEANVMQDTTSSTSAGSVVPNIDIGGMQGGIPEWLKWIIDNRDIILAVLLGIGSAIIAVKLGIDLIDGIGIGLIVAGIIKLIGDLTKLIVDPSWENFADVLIDIGIILAGLALIIRWLATRYCCSDSTCGRTSYKVLG